MNDFNMEEGFLMASCYRYCKHYSVGVCRKYHCIIPVSRNIWQRGLLIHPLNHISLLYTQSTADHDRYLVDLSKKYSQDSMSIGICESFDCSGSLTNKQRKALVYALLHCCEE